MNEKSYSYPDTIPDGCRKELNVHFSLEGGGQAFYHIKMPTGEYLPIGYQYDTRKPTGKLEPAETGFFIDGVERCFKSWKDVREFWPSFMAERNKNLEPVTQ